MLDIDLIWSQFFTTETFGKVATWAPEEHHYELGKEDGHEEHTWGELKEDVA